MEKSTRKTSELATRRQHHRLDASTMPVGRLATLAVGHLTGKMKPSYQPNRDDGDFVTVVNSGQLKFTGRKLQQKVYHRMTGFPGGIRTRKASELVGTKPADIIRHSIYYMLPKNRLRTARMRRLTISR